MALDLDFSKLHPQDVLDLAFFAEREAEEGYDRLAALMDSQSNTVMAAFFRRMATWEKEHQAKLAARRAELFPDAKANLSDRAPWSIELPDDETVTATITPRRALELAHAAEVSAFEYYSMALEYATNEGVVAVFELLRKEELGHQRLLEREMSKL